MFDSHFYFYGKTVTPFVGLISQRHQQTIEK
jgi:hypothetical protein